MPKLLLLSTWTGSALTPFADVAGVDDRGTIYGSVNQRPVRWTFDNNAPTFIAPTGAPAAAIGGFWSTSPDGVAVGELGKRALLATPTTAMLMPAALGLERLFAVSRTTAGAFWALGGGPSKMVALRIGAQSLAVQKTVAVDAHLHDLSTTIDETGRIAGYSNLHKRVVLLVPDGNGLREVEFGHELGWAARLVTYADRAHLVGAQRATGEILRAGILSLPSDLAFAATQSTWTPFNLVDPRGWVAGNSLYLPSSADRFPPSVAQLATTGLLSYDACVVVGPHATAITATCATAYDFGNEWLAAATWAAGSTANLNDALSGAVSLGVGPYLPTVIAFRLVRACSINSLGDIAGIAQVHFADASGPINPRRESPFVLLADRPAGTGRGPGASDSGAPGEARSMVAVPGADGLFALRSSARAQLDLRSIRARALSDAAGPAETRSPTRRPGERIEPKPPRPKSSRAKSAKRRTAR